jgi:general secretion pathway protein K
MSLRKVHNNQKGVALMIVLLLLATLAVIAVGMTQTMRLSVAKVRASEDVVQARWYALGAEILAAEVIEAQAQATEGVDTYQESWLTEEVVLPLDQGVMRASLADASVCFNINSLVTREDGALRANEQAVNRYRLLLDAVGFDVVAQRALSDALVDWLDSDSFSRSSGAEDPDYARLAQPYRTGNTLMADLSELRAVMWYTPEVYLALRPFICAYPDEKPAKINLNLVTQAQVPVLFAALEETLTIEEVANLVLSRPEEGYGSLDVFWGDVVFRDRELRPELQERTSLETRYISMLAEVSHNEAFIRLQSLIELTESGRARVVARKFGSDV